MSAGGARRRVVVLVGAACLACLAAGCSSKTTAAKALARELGVQLLRLQLVQVFSEFHGETEKNLEAVFHAATNAGAVILFDEADALFDKMTGSHKLVR